MRIVSCSNRSSSQRYTYLLIFFGVIAIINYWYLILYYWWAFLILGVIVKLIVDDSKKGKEPTRSVSNPTIKTEIDPTIRILKPVNITERISMIVAAYRICFSCGQGFPIRDQFQHIKCPNCQEMHHISNNIKLMHFKMIEGILNIFPKWL